MIEHWVTPQRRRQLRPSEALAKEEAPLSSRAR